MKFKPEDFDEFKFSEFSSHSASRQAIADRANAKLKEWLISCRGVTVDSNHVPLCIHWVKPKNDEGIYYKAKIVCIEDIKK